MIRSVGGGDAGQSLKVYCAVKSTLVTIGPVVGDIVEFSTSGNWLIDEHSTDAEIRDCGIIRELDDDNYHCVVEFFTWNKVFNVSYSGTATRGQAVITAASQTESVITSANATEADVAVVVATDVPASSYLDFITR